MYERLPPLGFKAATLEGYDSEDRRFQIRLDVVFEFTLNDDWSEVVAFATRKDYWTAFPGVGEIRAIERDSFGGWSIVDGPQLRVGESAGFIGLLNDLELTKSMPWRRNQRPDAATLKRFAVSSYRLPRETTASFPEK